MKAMICAAVLGTRLRPLTDSRPKALVEIAGRTLLEITLARLNSFGIRDVIVNVHHFAGMIVDYLKSNDNFGMRIEISREDDLLLDTGGGLKKAAWFFLNDSANEPFILHNVDVISTIDLDRMARFHVENRALATLAVQDRKSTRHLLFDKDLQLCGRDTTTEREREPFRTSPDLTPLAFSGIHVISPRLLPMITEEGVFSIIGPYVRLAAGGERIVAFRADEYQWRDVGRLDDVKRADEDARLIKQIV